MRIDGPQITSSLSLNGTTINDLNVFVTTASLNGITGSYATTGSNLFKGTQTISGSLLPAVNNAYDLGSVTHQFRDLYLSSASLYIDGTKVLGSTAQELTITTDTGQSFKILEAGADTITLQSVDGNVTLTSSGQGDIVLDPTTGIIGLKGTVSVYTGNKITSSDGNSIQFGNGIAVTGSIVSTATPLVSGSSQISYTGLSNTPSGIVSGSSQIAYTGITNIPSGIVSGSSQIIYSGLTGVPSDIISGSSQLTSSYDSRYVLSGSITQTTWDNIASKPNDIVSSSAQIGAFGFATTGSNTFQGNQTINGNLVVTGSLTAQQFIVSSSVTYLTTSFSSGSTKFGDSIDDTHQFTGSVNITGSLNISGSIISTVTPLVSGSNQISYTGITNIPSGIISGSDQLPSGIVSSSAQTIANLPAGTVSGSSQVIYSGLTGIPSGIISGSAQLPSGLVSGSSQILNGSGIFSGSAQLPSGIVSGSVQIIDLGFATTSSVITASAVRKVDTFTATANQSTFTASQGYSVGLMDVYVNGSKLAEADYVATNGTTVVLNIASEGGETVELYAYFQALNSNNALRTVTTRTATASQTLFTGITYTQGLIEVYYNGSRLSESEYTATNGTSVTLSTAANVGDILDFIAYNYTVGAFVGLSGTGTANYLPKYASTSSLTNSSIIDNSGAVTINGTLVVTGTTLVSGSSQISYTGLSSIPSGIVSGSAQIPSLLPSGVVSGSAQTIANLPSGTVSGSVQVDVMSTTNIARLATTGSNTFQGSQTINGNLVVTGSLTAQQFIVSSSVTYLTESFASGSHKFGDSLDDNHNFTGSVYVTSNSAGVTAGDFITDVTNKYVYVGRQSTTSGDNTTFIVRDRTGVARATIPGGGSTDIVFVNNASNFKVTNYGGTSLFTIDNTGAATFNSSISATSATFSDTVTINKTGASILTLGQGTSTNDYGRINFYGKGTGSGVSLLYIPIFNTQSGSATLVSELEVAHEGASADNKSYFSLKVHNGTSLINPLYIASTGAATFSSTIISNVSTNALNIGNSQNSVIALSTFGKTSTSGYATANNYLQIGAGENATSSTRLIGFGYSITANTNQPAYIGYIETSNAGETKGSLIFGTRDVTTDTAPTTRLTIASTGDATLSNTQTTFNFNPQTSLLASYYYLNFGGGSIMYRNNTDIYIGSNSKYGSAGTTVANYTSANGMGMLTMDGGTLNYQANATSVTAGTVYGMPVRFTIKGDGSVGVGTTTPASRLNVAGAKTNSADLSNSANQLAVTDTTATAVGVGGRISFLGSYSATPDYIAMGAIEVLKSNANNYGSSGWNNADMRFIVGNNDNDANSGRMLERMRISNGGSLLVGTSNADVGGSVPGTVIRSNGTMALAINMASPENYTSPIAVDRMNTAGDGLMYGMWRAGIFQAGIGATSSQSMTFVTAANASNSSQNIRMTITSNGSIGAPSGTNIYNPSDLRLKRNISTISNGLDKISALNPVKFNWIDGFESSEDGKEMLGFIAQEVQEALPEAVELFGGNIDLNGTIITNPLRVNEKFIIPVLVKAIQEQQQIINDLKDRITILENK